MRFLANGPNIPDELLEARDKGNVVFLCGAGVSIPAKMPNFLGLAKSVVDALGAPPKGTLRKMLSLWDRRDISKSAKPPPDQIFNLLQQEYDESEVDYFIAKKLEARDGIYLGKHETILRLSKGADGNPQIVTTNFDHLFELAARDLHTYIPPTFPSLTSEGPLDGLVYLHGRIDPEMRPGKARQGLIVSSSDFGRAYLAEGWVTRFMRDLLKEYIVVLLGYSADDPPMTYLLQGLRSMDRRNQETIYAFVSDSEEDVEESWRDRGVEALVYPVVAGGHSALWDTLEAWAQRADDPLAWQQEIVELARKGPRNLEQHERGQVASLVKTIDGAKLFAEADPPPPGEWLCVFDSTVQYGKVEKDVYELLPNFGPHVEYGLDDDPPRPQGDRSEEAPSDDDLLSLRATDPYKGDYVKLAEMLPQKDIALPDRLAQLVFWIVKVAHEPVVPWWAAKHKRHHPILMDRIERRIRQDGDNFPPRARSIWRLLIEKFRNIPDDNGSLFKMEQRIKAEGWTCGVLRAFERSIAPRLKSDSRPGGSCIRPPEMDWENLQVSNIAEFEVAFPRILDIRSEIPDETLPAVYSIGRRQLELAVGLLGDVDLSAQERMKFYLRNNTGAMSGDNPNIYLQWFRDLLSRMAETRPELVRADVSLWPKEDLYFFDKLRLFVWSFETLYSGEEVTEGLLSFSDDAFWDSSYGPELLHLVRDRWRQLPLEKRRLLEKRIVQGPPKWSDEAEEEYKKRSSLASAKVLGWLIEQSCDLSQDTLSILPELQTANPLWHSDLDKRADEPFGAAKGGWINPDEDPSALINAPVSKIISLARANTSRSYENMTDYLPFDGLVKRCPRKTMAALTREARKGDYPMEFWIPLLREWPNDARPRLTWLLGARIARLPSEIMMKLRFFVFSWVEKHIPRLVMMDQDRAWSILDGLLDRLFAGGDDATGSAIYGVRVAGDNQSWSRRTIKHAENGPVGKIAWLLIDVLKSWNLERDSGVPSEVKVRLERLVHAPGEGGDHAVCVIADRFEWLFHLDPEWTRNFIIPWFDPDHPCSEPAWNGLLRRHRLATPELLSLLKTHFLGVFSRVKGWKWSDDGLQVLHEFLVQGCLRSDEDEAYLTYPEVRIALQKTDDSGRVQSIKYLSDCIEKNQESWHDFGKPFLEEAWPKETRFQTEDTAITLSQIAGVTGDHFPEAVQTILPRLVQIKGDSGFLYRVVSRGGEEEFELATQFPKPTLTLVNKLVPDSPPKRLSDLDFILEKIVEAKPTLRQNWRWRRLKKITRQE